MARAASLQGAPTQHAFVTKPSLIQRFPPELLLMIKGLLDPHDIVENVCYYLICRSTAACYPHDPHDDYWRTLARMNGLGRGTYGGPVATYNYRGMVVACARHAWKCNHPGCGRARLDENRCLVVDAKARWPSWEYDAAVSNPEGNAPPDEDTILSSPVLSHIAFKNNSVKPRAGVSNFSSELGDIPYLRPPEHFMTALEQEPPADTLEDHPIAKHTLATFPPLDVLSLSNIAFDFPYMLNPTGVTAGDMAYYMGLDMRKKVLAEQLAHLLQELESNSDDAFPRDWSLIDIVGSVAQRRDWFKVVHWTGLKYTRFGPNRYFDLEFAARELPDDSEDIEGLSRYDEETWY